MPRKKQEKSIIDIGVELKKKELSPKLFVVSLQGHSQEGLNIMTSVNVSFTLEEAIEKAKAQANKMASDVGRRPIEWNIHSYVDFTTSKLISLFHEFKGETKNKNSAS